MLPDRSEGWDEIADAFMAARSDIGAELVRGWARMHFPGGAQIVDIGCGSGIPMSAALIAEGFQVSGIDASPRLIAAFRVRFPQAAAVCEAAQESDFFGRTFDAAIAVGLLFLLAAEDQREVIRRVATALKPGGRLLFSAPMEACEWDDLLTGRRSRSFGRAEYDRILDGAGLRFAGCCQDEGGNNYYDAVRPLDPA
ncbi:class I SAM-dependent methyltransferase [Hyphomonas sp.]|uniref:class I SAM-dependent methyltransferase n=1 Tax=Hyphomonas sp. TaxID=87 RepID=UPI003919FBD3